MEQSNNIDHLLRERLRHSEVPPPAFVWPNVEQALRRRKRRFIVFWFLAAGLAAGLTGAGLWMFWPHAKPAAVRPIAQKTAPLLSVNAPLLPASLPDHTAAPVATAPATGQKTAAIPARQSMPAARTIPTTTSAATNRIPASDQVNFLQPDAAGVEPNILQTNAERTDQTAEPVATPDIRQTNAKRTDQTAEPVATSVKSAGITAQLPGVLLGSLDLPERTFPLSPVIIAVTKAKKAPRKCYDFHSNREAWLLDAYVGPAWSNKRLQSGNSEFRDYIHDRERTEKKDWGFNAGVRASYLFAGNFMLRTGLHYDYQVEQFEYFDPNFIRYNITVTQKLINGQWVSVTDTTGIEYGTEYRKTYNRFALLDIPLQAALELRSGPTGISLNLGGSVNVLFEKRGSILTPDGKPTTFTPSQGQYDVFRTRVGMSLLGSIQWFYHISPRTRVFAEPYYRHIVEPVTRAGYPVEQSLGVGGIRFGVTRIFD